jgi:hypothetical protein
MERAQGGTARRSHSMKKPKVLTKLRIDEVSSCDKGAGDGCKIVLSKRDDRGDHYRRFFGKIFSAAPKRGRPESLAYLDKYADARRPIGGYFARKNRADDVADLSDDDLDDAVDDIEGDDNDDGNGGSRHEVNVVADLIVEGSNGEIDRPTAVRYLLHDKNGAALLQRLRARKAHTNKQKDDPMDRMDSLKSFAKTNGMVGIAKHIVDGGDVKLTEAEFTSLATEAAKSLYPNDRADIAFSKYFAAENEDAVLLRKAHALVRDQGFIGAERTVAPVSAVDKQAVTASGSGGAYEALMAKAAELRADVS